ncbi:MAG TPA: hypothetical protein DDX85_13680 [Nitrospiraceae bacterium]|nr:hypothetical protein [Nitrospiraceae bacterium]
MLIFFVTGYAFTQEIIIYPAKGQSNEQLEKDKFECYTWAKGQTGFDPMEVPTATAPPPEAQAGSGGAIKGAAAGAIVGAAAGGISKKGNVGKGAAYGAGAGALLGGMNQAGKRQEDERRQQQWEKEQVAQYTQKRNSYNRAYGACLEGRGYTVK